MNENKMRENHADPCDPTERDPLPSETSETTHGGEPLCENVPEIEDVCNEGIDPPPVETDVESAPTDSSGDPEVPADSDPNPDPDHSPPVEASPEEQLQQLRDELTRLRQEMSRQQALLSRMGEECEEFHTLYPETPLSSLPDNVWADVKQGIPLAAAYALAERRRAYTESIAAAANQQNGQRSTGALEATDTEYFSPGEVRAMTQAEVRTNYQKIMRSMQKWR